jgi:hypothetical protein
MPQKSSWNAVVACAFFLAALPLSAIPSLAGSLPEDFLGLWASTGTGTDNVQSGSDSNCTGEQARITKKVIDWDALGKCQIGKVESELSHLPDADPSYKPSIKVTLSCEGMYHPLKDTEIWYTFVINGQWYMTQTSANKAFHTDLYKKCRSD